MNETPSYHSRFGGLWIDQDDWRQEVTRRGLDEGQKELVERFVADGYVILENAIPHEIVDAFANPIAAAFQSGNSDILYQPHGDSQARPMAEGADGLTSRVVDAYVPLPQALDLFAAPALLNFLQTIFADDPLLFQSLNFEKGSQQPLHQDTAYVVVDGQPLQLAACWIALEDIVAGSGELMYAPGSHRLPDWQFGGDKKHWNPELDGMETHGQWAVWLEDQARAGRGVGRFLARKGDILVWHADLAHGGSPVADPALTRRSLVGHFCPQRQKPYYFGDPAHAAVRHHGALGYASQHFQLSPMDKPKDRTPPSTPRSMFGWPRLSLAQLYAKRKLSRSS
ncbi:phytanoyl-CoA dioxygenase family protein [Sphingobium rhizovicinum]|uniref:Phytanoyl-CoA dioxygenase family protein n=1 Tax=Sphingobium rhizovicinum TaxID=432308 RepID=A0ABV7NDE9_9SPHN